MARLNPNFMVLATFAITGILMFSGTNNVVLGQGCQGDFQGLITQCSMYVQKTGPKTDPSQGCCNVIKAADIPCICQHITPEVERVIDMEKVVYVAQFCGRPLAHGTKCGSYTVPSQLD
ncbi:Bifunctional inhibitor/lipid-transfer protein/seed storage 2S albumin superfamily protein [Quillaja saponaria]|uniref:Bifunctional inhibitor/lipid-transfer protein/seed storage 2S albumin superfamily protein n=1 Tax=Quillaja saponaria TaxID=32244 RepID=A0AAD7PBM8_QUISA|nr:Bifunctional inhibitor/lipid-transfer protein/seed storage 2S albumin superfamily protein [Quillaja saponaria]